MSIKSLIVTAVLVGGSTAAVATPAQLGGSVDVGARWNAEPAQYTPPGMRDHHYDRDDLYQRERREHSRDFDREANVRIGPEGSYYVGPIARLPSSGHVNMPLTAPTSIVQGRETFDLGSDVGVVSQLRLEAQSGATYIRDVHLVLGKGDVQVVHVNAWLDGRNPTISFDVDNRRGRAIQQIIIDGDSHDGGRFLIRALR